VAQALLSVAGSAGYEEGGLLVLGLLPLRLEQWKGILMPIRIFVVQGDKPISTLESEINKWQQSLGAKASVTHMSTAMTEHRDESGAGQTRLAVTIWYEE
jgi:hypothetical protein